MKTTRSADIVRLVHDRRDVLGLTQQQVAERAGVSRQLVARIENGVGDPSLGTLFRVLDALGMELRAELRDEPAVVPEPRGARIHLRVPVPALDVSRLTTQLSGWKYSALSAASREEHEASTTPSTDGRTE